MKIFAFDPGLTTGWALFDGAELVDAGQIAGVVPAMNLISLHCSSGIDVAIGESFVITLATAKKSPQAQPLRILGAAEYLCALHGVPLVEQLPVQAKKLVSDDSLRNLGWYKPTSGGHRNDAIRHGVVYLLQHGTIGVQALRTHHASLDAA